MGDFSFAHLVLLVIVGIIVYGKDLPQAARKLAIMYNKFRRQIADIKDEIQRQIPMEEIKNEIRKVETGFDPNAPQTEIPLPPTSVFAQIVDARTFKEVKRVNIGQGGANIGFSRDGKTVFIALKMRKSVTTTVTLQRSG